MNGEKMGNEEGFDSYASDEWTTEDSHDRQQFAIKVECFFDDLKEKIEKKVDELSQTVEEKITIRMEELLQEMEDRISNRTSRIFAKAEEDSQIPLKKRKQYVISIDGTDNLDTPSVDHLDESNHHHSQALNERVEVLETSVNKLLQAVFPRVETSQQLPDSSKSPNTFTVDPSFVCERVPSNPPKLTTFPRTCLVRDKKCTHGTEGRLKEGNRLKQNVKGTQTSSSISKASPSFTVVKDKSTCPIKDQRLREVISSAKSHKLLTDHFEQYSSSGEESSDDIVEKEQMSTDRATISSKSPEKPREKQTGYTEMLDFQTAISGYSFSSTSVNPACSVKPRQYSNSSLPTSPTGKMCGSGSGDTSEEKSRDTPYADDTFSTMIDLSSEIVAPSQPCSREKSPVPQPSVCGLPLNSYIVVKVLSDGDTTSASEGLKNPIKEMILPIFDHPTSNTRISTVSKQKQSTKREGLVCVPPPIETLIQPEIKTNNKTEDRSNAASGTGTQSKFRIPATISSDYCRPSSTTDVMSSVSTGILPTGHLKTVVEKLVEEPRALSDTNTARRLCSGTAAHKLTQQSDRSLPSTCRTPFEDLKVQIATRKASGTLTSSNICSLSSTPSQSLPLTIPASTIERRVDQSRATRDSSQSSASHRLLSSTGRSPLTSTPVHESITDSRVDQSTALSDTSQSSTSHRLLSTTGYSSPPSSRYLESTTGRRDDPSSVLSDTSQSSNTNRPPSTGTRLSPTTSPPRVLESIIERRVDQSRALRYAAAEGRVAELRQLLADGADPDARNAEGCTVLHCAARRGMWLAINALLDAGANVHAKDRVGWTALHCAAAYDPAALCVTALAKAGADVNERSNSKLTPLHLAAKYNNEKAARALLEAGACKTIMDAHGRTPIQVMGNAMEHLPVAAPLSPAPRDKEAERRRFWDEELLAAVEQGNLHQAEAALREGASVDARDVEGGGGGWTALHLAASRGDTALVRLLLESGAHPGRRDAYGWTALHFAASTDFALGVRLLACAGADPEARDAFGCTPLHLAARWDRQAALLELLRLGANAHAHDARGLTPFERAPSARVRRLLRSQGAAHAGSRAAAAAAARGDLAHGVRYRVSMDGSEDVELPKSPCDKVPDSSAWRIFQRNKSNEGAELATSHGDVAETKKNEHSPKGEKEKVSNVTTDPNIQEYNPDVSDTNELAMEEIYDSGEILMEKTSGSADTFAQVSITENKENIDSENKDESEPKSN